MLSGQKGHKGLLGSFSKPCFKYNDDSPPHAFSIKKSEIVRVDDEIPMIAVCRQYINICCSSFIISLIF